MPLPLTTCSAWSLCQGLGTDVEAQLSSSHLSSNPGLQLCLAPDPVLSYPPCTKAPDPLLVLSLRAPARIPFSHLNWFCSSFLIFQRLFPRANCAVSLPLEVVTPSPVASRQPPEQVRPAYVNVTDADLGPVQYLDRPTTQPKRLPTSFRHSFTFVRPGTIWNCFQHSTTAGVTRSIRNLDCVWRGRSTRKCRASQTRSGRVIMPQVCVERKRMSLAFHQNLTHEI